MNEIFFSGQITYEELIEAHDAILKTPGKFYKFFLVLIASCVFLLLIMTMIVRHFPSFATDIINGGHPVSPMPYNTSALLAILIIIVLFPILKAWNNRRGKKAFLEDKFRASADSYILSEKAFVCEGKYGKGCIPWRDFIRWQETPKFFLFYEAEYRAIVLPKRFLKESEQTQLKTWLSNITTNNQKVSSETAPHDASST
jgi:hypothetical protein